MIMCEAQQSRRNRAELCPDFPNCAEYGSEEKAAEFYQIVEEQGWTAISMANDWAVIYGDQVHKTGLPGAVETAPEAETEELDEAA